MNIYLGTYDMYTDANNTGINDLANATQRLGSLLNLYEKYYPNALFLVAQILPPADDGTALAASIFNKTVNFNSKIPAVVAERAVNGSKIMVVDMFTEFTAGRTLIDRFSPTRRDTSRWRRYGEMQLFLLMLKGGLLKPLH